MSAFMVICIELLGAGLFAAGDPVPLYVWGDVAAVQFLSAVPLAILIAAVMRRGISTPVTALSGAAVLVFTGAVIFSGSPVGPVWRAVAALGVTTGAALLSAALLAKPSLGGRSRPVAQLAAFALLGLAALVLPVATYIGARVTRDLTQLSELLEQSRFGEAQSLARRLLAFDPGAKLDRRPLSDVAGEIDRVVLELESSVASPLAAIAEERERLDRARALAMLGRTDGALDLLRDAPAWDIAAEACNLRGLIYETTGEWALGRECYQRASSIWEAMADSPERTAGLVQALHGIAYCERKMGDNPAAESAYLQSLELAPTADSHFLLARFYEDTQQSAKAREHARRAMLLAPSRYQKQGEELIDKLMTLHFGCLGAYNAEGQPLSGRGAFAAP